MVIFKLPLCITPFQERLEKQTKMHAHMHTPLYSYIRMSALLLLFYGGFLYAPPGTLAY